MGADLNFHGPNLRRGFFACNFSISLSVWVTEFAAHEQRNQGTQDNCKGKRRGYEGLPRCKGAMDEQAR